MKILQVINSLSTGGAERLVADLAPKFNRDGNECDVLLLRGGDTPFRRELEKAGVKVFDFGAGTNVYSPLNIFRIIPFLKQYDVVHVHLFPAQYWVALAKFLAFSKARLVTTEHSTNNRRRNSVFFRVIDRFIYKLYSKIIGISSKTSENLRKHIGTGTSIETILNGIDLPKFANAEPASLGTEFRGNEFLCVQVAGFREAKDQEALIRALTLLPENVHAVFAGDGVRREQVEQLAETCGVRSRAHFLGVRADVPAVLKAANVVVMSSHWEGLSLAVIEGTASGKPVIASDVPGLREVVSGAGILFPASDEKALAREIKQLLDDPAHYAQIAEQCSRRAQDFDIQKTIAAYWQVYGSK